MKQKQAILIALLAAGSIGYAACSSTSTGPAPTPPAGPTAVPLAAPTFAAVSTTSFAAGGVAPLPTGAPISGSIDLGTASALPAGTLLTTTLTSAAPSANGVPQLSEALRKALARRYPQSANGSIVVLAYIDLLFSQNVTFAQSPSFTLGFPASLITSANYYIAAYDPTRPSLGWQLGFSGAASKLNATTLVFAGVPSPFTFARNAYYYFAPYAISTTANAPTPAPSIAPVAPATAAPTSSPTITPTTAPTTVPSTSPSAEPSGTISPTPAPTLAPTLAPSLPSQ